MYFIAQEKEYYYLTTLVLIAFTILLSTIAFLDHSIVLGQQEEEVKQPPPIPVPTEPQVFKVLSKSNDLNGGDVMNLFINFSISFKFILGTLGI